MDEWGKELHDFVFEKTGWQMPRGDSYISVDPLKAPVAPRVFRTEQGNPALMQSQGIYPPVLPQPGKYLERATSPVTQRGELKVTFDNAPPGMRVQEIPKSGDPLMNITHDVGYSPFRTPR